MEQIRTYTHLSPEERAAIMLELRKRPAIYTPQHLAR